MSEDLTTDEGKTTPPADPPRPNTEEARNPDGSLKSPTSPAQTEEEKAAAEKAAAEEAAKKATETQTEEEKKAAAEKAKKEEAAGAPEKYENFTAPEGYTINEEVITEANTLFKELNLSQTQAQRLVDFYAQRAIEAGDAQYKLYDDTRKEWRGEIVKDSVLGDGKEGLKPEVNQAIARVIGSLGDELGTSFRQAMDLTGAGDHPAFARALFELSKKLPQEGTHVTGTGPAKPGQPGSKPTSVASAMYPNLPSGGG